MSQKLSPADSRHELDGKGRNETDKNSAYHQLSTQHTAQQLNAPESGTQSSEYNSDTQRRMLDNSQQSFNEQRDTYTEQAFNCSEQQTDNASVMPMEENELSSAYSYYNHEKSNEMTLDENTYEDFKRYVNEDFEQYAERITTGSNGNDAASASNKPANIMDESKHSFPEKDKKLATDAETPEKMKLSGQQHKGRARESKNQPKLKDGKETYQRISTDKTKRLTNGNGDSRIHKRKDETAKRLHDKHSVTDSENTEKPDRAGRDTLKRNNPANQKKEADETGGNDEKPEPVSAEKLRLVRIQGEKELKSVQESVEKTYSRQVKDRDRKDLKRRIKGRLMFSSAKTLFDDETIEKDDTASDFSRTLKKGGRTAAFILRQNERDLRNMYSRYGRLKYIIERDQYHISRHERLDNKAERRKERRQVKEAATKEERKRRKKEMQKARIEREGNFIRRTQSQFKMKKRSAAHKRHKAKRTLKTIAAVGSILGISMLSGIMILLAILCLTQGAAEYYAEGVVQVDYDTMTDATEYYKNLEADLEEYLSDKPTLENELRAEHGNDIYEFHYDICGFGFSANTILAYLAAKYNEFTINDAVKEDLKEVLQEMYVLSVSTRMEDREIDGETEQKKICYITLTRTELEEIVEGRLTDDELELYRSYKLTTGGQQVYGPVMREDWTNLISSNYGDRIHPITKVRTTHKGVDIAVPTGTKLYSAVKGTVTVARYSETAGNMVTVKNSTGWTVTFMHMDSIAVSVSQNVEKGDFIGYSGNTGNSTGPHLHLH